jgi:hypothetical protein
MALPLPLVANNALSQRAHSTGSLGALAVEISLACDAGAAPHSDMAARTSAALERAVADPDLLSAKHRAPERKMLHPPCSLQRSVQPFHHIGDRLGTGAVQPAART